MQLGYNTNGFAFHSLDSALRIIAEIGYSSVALTLDVHHLNPFSDSFEQELSQTKQLFAELGLSCVVETGSRFLLNPLLKHEPTLLSDSVNGRQQRIEYYIRSIDIANSLNANAISLWSGIAPQNISSQKLYSRLICGLEQVCRYAEKTGIKIAFEPEPGMLIDTMASFQMLLKQFEHPLFGLTIDIGHLQCLESDSIPDVLTQWKDRIWNIHIEDMKAGVHDHLQFGEGEIDFPPVMRALEKIKYAGGVHVELSRHSHIAPTAAKLSYQVLNSLLIK